MFKPKLFTCMQNYSKDQFKADAVAGIIVGIIALPLSVALGIASGVSPQIGLTTAIIGGFIVSLLGGSRVQIGGPTGAFIVIVLGIINEYGLSGLCVATCMAGIMLVFMGIFKVGNVIKFIPYPIITGFTNGIAVIIFSTQIKDFFGLDLTHVPMEFAEKWQVYFANVDKINYSSFLLGILSVVIIAKLPKWSEKIPSTLAAIVVTTLISLLFGLDTPTIGSQFGNISVQSFELNIIPVDLAMIKTLLAPALTIALLGSIESLLSAVVADGMISGNHRSNTELIAQGIANIFSSLFGGIPVTGAIARTAANIKSGARTPIAGIIHAVFLLVTMFLFMEYFEHVPMATLAGILMIVSYKMGNWKEFKNIFRTTKDDMFVFLSTFLLTIIFDLTIAIEVGIVLASFLFMGRMVKISGTNLISAKDKLGDENPREKSFIQEKDVIYYEISGPFFFGTADKFVSTIKSNSKMPKLLIIDLAKVPIIDSTGFHALQGFYRVCQKSKTKVLFINIDLELLRVLDRFGFTQLVGKNSICKEVRNLETKIKILLDK